MPIRDNYYVGFLYLIIFYRVWIGFPEQRKMNIKYRIKDNENNKNKKLEINRKNK